VRGIVGPAGETWTGRETYGRTNGGYGITQGPRMEGACECAGGTAGEGDTE
jgi:hypothetical protein